ncbi:MAG: segregation/condensation protein A [Mycoplasmatota bacterium]
MDYKVKITDFEGPLDLLLHLIKESSIDIYNIKINDVIKQYFDFINEMKQLNLNIASEYLVMAAQLLEIKAASLFPKEEVLEEESKEEELINKLIEYKKYKEITAELKELEDCRKNYYTKETTDLKKYAPEEVVEDNVTLNDLLNAFNKFLEDKKKEQPLSTKITTKEYSVSKRSNEIKTILKRKKHIYFSELFEVFTKDYVVVTFLSILDMTKRNEIELKQEKNYNNILITEVKK